MGNKQTPFEIIEEALSVMEDPAVGVKTQEDPFYGVDYDEDLYDAFDQQVPEGGPKAGLWGVIVAPCVPRTTSKGGIELPHAVREAEEHLNYLARIVHMGPLAGHSSKYHIITNRFLYWITGGAFGWASAYTYKVGDLVIFGRYAGQKMFYKGARLVLLNDDEIRGHAESPKGFKIYVAG